MKTQTLFSGKWVQTKPLPIAKPKQPTLRPSQARAFAALKDKERVVLQAPTGWGKSLLIASLVLHELLRNPDLRCVNGWDYDGRCYLYAGTGNRSRTIMGSFVFKRLTLAQQLAG